MITAAIPFRSPSSDPKGLAIANGFINNDTHNRQSCVGQKKAMLAFGLIQISASVVSAVSLAAIAFGLFAVK